MSEKTVSEIIKTTKQKDLSTSDKALISKDQERIESVQFIESLTKVNATVVAWAIGIATARQVVTNLSMPINLDGTYNLQNVIRYCIHERHMRKDRPGDMKRIAKSAGNPIDESVLDYKRKLEAKKIELQLLEMEKTVVAVDMANEFFAVLSSRIRSLGELMQRQYGRDALLLVHEALDDIDASVRRWKFIVDNKNDG